MKVINRRGEHEDISFDAILFRIRSLSDRISKETIDPSIVAQKVTTQLYDQITTRELDVLSAEVAMQMSTIHPDYNTLASHLLINNLHKDAKTTFTKTTETLYEAGLLHETYYQNVKQIGEQLDQRIDYDRDYRLDYFGFKTLERGYLLKVRDRPVELPQDLWMRVSVQIHGTDLERVLETYDSMSRLECIHATPTLFNSGTKRPQLASCFLMGTDDSIEGIFKTVGDCGKISKWAGGIGIHMNNIRAKGSLIQGTGGKSSGLVPQLRIYNNVARAIDQGGKRNGSIAVYLSPDHVDFEDFIDLRKNHGDNEQRCRDLFLAAWVPDLFMKRVEHDADWSMFSPDTAPGLDEAYGDAYETLYETYEKKGLARKTVSARKLWYQLLNATIETGTPYILFKDHINHKSNQSNVGTIKSSNLCAEIMEYSDANEYAVCNLGSIALSKCVSESGFDFETLGRLTRMMVRNLDRIIDQTFYPVPETERSNQKHRPIGLGVQGLSDAYQLLHLPFDSMEAHDLNRNIFECMYYHAVNESVALAREKGTYSTFGGSPMSQGKFQFDLWGVTPSNQYDWEGLRSAVQTHGVRNSLLIALMPTASTGQILGNTECFEPCTSNMYARRTLAGEFIVVNKHLVRDLIHENLWSEQTRQDIIRNRGSIQALEYIPRTLKDIYKTVWEIRQKVLIDQAADRGPFVCQSQSMNLFFAKPTLPMLNSAMIYGWKRGLKTGVYYTRTLPVADAVNITTRHTTRGTGTALGSDEHASPTQQNDVTICESCSG